MEIVGHRALLALIGIILEVALDVVGRVFERRKSMLRGVSDRVDVCGKIPSTYDGKRSRPAIFDEIHGQTGIARRASGNAEMVESFLEYSWDASVRRHERELGDAGRGSLMADRRGSSLDGRTTMRRAGEVCMLEKGRDGQREGGARRL
jgi:hypothetical protein